MFDSDFMLEVDTERPLDVMRQEYFAARSEDLLDRMLHYDWKFTLADNDLRKVTTMCTAAGIEVAFPMLDNRVVDSSIEIPSDLKMRNLQLRSFFKRAMKDFLPEAILKKKKHGFGLPFGQWLKSHRRLADMVYGSLTDLKCRRIVRPDFIDQLIRDHRHGDAGYYGYVIWDLVILEEWFKGQRGLASTTVSKSLQGVQ
jgi:asparagine synthase (glutamine-hydrolysing)